MTLPQQASTPPSSDRACTLSKLALSTPVKAWSLVGSKGTWTDLWKCPKARPTDCLNGMRVLSMAWIILGHSFLVTEGNAGFSNAEDIEATPFTPDAAETTG